MNVTNHRKRIEVAGLQPQYGIEGTKRIGETAVAIKQHAQIEMDAGLIGKDGQRAAVEILGFPIATLRLPQQAHELQRIGIERGKLKRALAECFGLR